MLRELFTEHPNSVEETYTEHMGMAFSFAMPLCSVEVDSVHRDCIPENATLLA